jgi:hypothetical protein
MVTRFPWGKFPAVIVHTTRASVEAHAAFPEASQGDFAAAQRLARDLAKPAVWTGRVDYICPVVQCDSAGRWNAIPVALAEILAEQTGATLVAHVVREKAAPDLSTTSIARLVQQSGFDGRVPKGTYLICQDICTFGSTIANLRGHIEHQGSTVVAATSLAAAIFGTTLVPDNTVLMGISARFRHELSTITTQLGFDYDRLTAREAYFIYGLKNLESLRNPQAPTHRIAGPKI